MTQRWFAGLMLALASGGATAEWTLVGSTEGKGGVDYYIDRATLSKTGNTVQLWMMEDYKVAQTFSGKTFLSAKLQHEYDCKDSQRRTLQSSLYSGWKGGGTVVLFGTNPAPWRPVSAGTVGETLWKMACGKK